MAVRVVVVLSVRLNYEAAFWCQINVSSPCMTAKNGRHVMPIARAPQCKYRYKVSLHSMHSMSRNSIKKLHLSW